MAICMYNIIYVCYISCKNYKINVVLCSVYRYDWRAIAGMGGDYGVTDRSHLLQLDIKNREFAFLCFDLCGVVLHF